MAAAAAAAAPAWPDFAPARFEPDDPAMRDYLDEHGFVAIKAAASEQELEGMREQLWEFLTTEQCHENGTPTPGWRRDDVTTWSDERFNDPQAGLMGGASHCDAFWRCRTLPRVCEGFATVYGTHDLVTSFDRASINRPQACGAESVLNMGSGPARLDADRLHTHFNQDGYGEEVQICYGILPLWDMNRRTGATAIVPGSHKKVKEIERRRREFNRELFKDSPGHLARDALMAEFQSMSDAARSERRPELFAKFRALRDDYPEMEELERAARDTRKHFFEPFTELGLTPGVVDARAGDLIIFDTALYHGCCNAEEPFGTDILRTIFIQSMVPVELLGQGRGKSEPGYAGLDHTTTVLAARKRAYETGHVTGGSVLSPSQARAMLEADASDPRPTIRDWDATPWERRRLVCPIDVDVAALQRKELLLLQNENEREREEEQEGAKL
jgi:hypothetical protein